MAFTPTRKGPDYARLHATLANTKLQVQGQINNNAVFQTISQLINGVKEFQDIVNAAFGSAEELLAFFGQEFTRRNSEKFGVSVNNSTNQPAPDNVEVILAYDTTVFDPGSIFDGTDTFTAPADAQYFVSGQVGFSGTGGNSRFLFFRRNADLTDNPIKTIQRGTTDGIYPMSGLIELDEGDTLQFIAMQNSGIASTTSGSFQMFRVSY